MGSPYALISAALIGLFYWAVIGGLTGALIGYLPSRIQKIRLRSIAKSVALGSGGALLGVIGAVIIPYPYKYAYDTPDGAKFLASGTAPYPHPEIVGLALAIVLPLTLELYRFVQSRKRRQTVS